MNIQRDVAMIGIVVTLSLVTYLASINGALSLLVRENGILENAQLVFIALALVAFSASGLWHEGPAQTAGRTLAGLCLICLFRELDLRDANVPGWLAAATRSPVRDIIVGAMATVMFGYMFGSRAHRHGWFWMLVRWQSWPLFLSGAFLFLAVILDYKVVHNNAGRLWEELAETIGYVMLLEAAFRHQIHGATMSTARAL